jgi:hypothetical protein
VTAAAPITTGTTTSRRCGIVIQAICIATTREGEGREQTPYMFAMTPGTDYVISMLMIYNKFEFGFAVRAIVLVQWHNEVTSGAQKTLFIKRYCSV